MKPEVLDKLLVKYEDGRTSLKEEQAIKKHFAKCSDKTEDSYYQRIFSLYKLEQEKEIPELEKPGKPESKLKWLKVAATIIVIIAGTFFYQRYQSQQQLKQQQAQEVFNQTKEVLNLVANKFQQGKSNLILLKNINETKNQYIK